MMKKSHTFTKDVRSPNVEKVFSNDPGKGYQKLILKKSVKSVLPRTYCKDCTWKKDGDSPCRVSFHQKLLFGSYSNQSFAAST